jgi:hypothetical protein
MSDGGRNVLTQLVAARPSENAIQIEERPASIDVLHLGSLRFSLNFRVDPWLFSFQGKGGI